MRLGTRVWSFGKFLLLTGALGATFLLFFGISVRVALRAQEVDVPSVVGRSTEEATTLLSAVGLGVRVDPSQQVDNTIPAGRVMRQDPVQGSQARRDRTVRVWVSAGPRATTVPQLSGASERLARIRLAQEGLEIASVSEIRSTEYEPDAVVAQDPPGAARAPRVSLLVSRGEPGATHIMPELTGRNADTVAADLESRGFRVSQTPISGQGVPPGMIVRQRPTAGFRVSQQDPISLEVSR